MATFRVCAADAAQVEFVGAGSSLQPVTLGQEVINRATEMLRQITTAPAATATAASPPDGDDFTCTVPP